MKLNVLAMKRLTKPGKHADGGGLYLYVKPGGARFWVFRYMLFRRRREMGLGSLESMSLAEARELARECRRDLGEGRDPIDGRHARKAEAMLAASLNMTFIECAMLYIKEQTPAWTHRRQPEQWENSLRNHVPKLILNLPVSKITRENVLQALRPIWHTKPETAARVRLRMERVLGFATVMGYRKGENPAAWRGNLDHILPSRSKVKAVEHFPAVSMDELPGVYKDIASKPGTPHRAFEFLILTTTRTNETLGARWEEIDWANKTWTVPIERMGKTKVPHRVPLSARAIAVLEEQRRVSRDAFIFPGRYAHRPLSNMALLMIMRRMGRMEVPHGFRSTFSDWTAECTDHSRDVREMALAHTIENKTEASYRRGDLFEKRRQLMEDWATFCVQDIEHSRRAEALKAGEFIAGR